MMGSFFFCNITLKTRSINSCSLNVLCLIRRVSEEGVKKTNLLYLFLDSNVFIQTRPSGRSEHCLRSCCSFITEPSEGGTLRAHTKAWWCFNQWQKTTVIHPEGTVFWLSCSDGKSRPAVEYLRTDASLSSTLQLADGKTQRLTAFMFKCLRKTCETYQRGSLWYFSVWTSFFFPSLTKHMYTHMRSLPNCTVIILFLNP